MFCKPPHPPMHPVYIVIFRGDDTDFTGNQEILVKIHTDRDISGCKAYFKYMGNVQTFEEIPEDKELHLVFSREQTKDMPLGTWDAELYLIDEQGRRMTINNRIHMLVTNSVHEAYFPDDPQAVTVVINANEYVKDAEVSQDGKTLTLTKRDGTTVSFRGGGGGGGTDDYNDLENKPTLNGETLQGAVVLTGVDIETEPNSGRLVTEAIVENKNRIDYHEERHDNPHNVTAEQVGTYTTAEIDDKITRFVAHYLTTREPTAGGGYRYIPFKTHGSGTNPAQYSLAYAKKYHSETNPQFFYAGEPFTPTKNDYCVVLADETYSGKTTRYSFVGDWPTGQFQYQYTINDTAFSQAQWDAINSGVTAEKLADIELAFEEIHDQIGNIDVEISSLNNGLGEVSTALTKKADKLADTVVAKIDEDRHDDSIKPKIIRVPIEFARKSFNAVTVKFYYDPDEDDRDCYLLVGYSVGDGGSSGVAYEDRILKASSSWTYVPREEGDYTFKFGEDISKLIPSEAKFLTFFFTSTDIIEDPEFLGTPIETGYATDEEVTQKKYQIQQNAGFFFVDHAPLMEFLFIDDPVARKSSVDSVADKVDGIKETVSTDNRFLVNDTTAAIQTRESETAEWQTEIRVDKGYDAVTGSTMVKLDKSVQKITVASSSLSIVLPEETQGTVRDLCLYVNNNSGADCALMFPAGTYYGDNPNGAVAKDGGVTAVYITEMPVDSWMLRIVELEQFTVEVAT